MAILIRFYKFLINNENPIIIKIDKMVFLNISLDNFILILVPKYWPINAGIVTNRLINKSKKLPKPWYISDEYKGIEAKKYIVAVVLIKLSFSKFNETKNVIIGGA